MPAYVFPGSRYEGLALRSFTDAEGRELPYLERRFPPRAETLEEAGLHRMGPRERLDHAAAAAIGDPLRFWMLCDANAALAPWELEQEGRLLRVASAFAGVRLA